MEKIYYDIISSPFCPIILVGNDNGLKYLHLDTGKGKRIFKVDNSWERKKGYFTEAEKQIGEYFANKRKIFQLKLNPNGTDFQKKVWKELQNIPFGETKTYGEIAKNIGNKNASRAIGMANSKNPIPLLIPCHRVIGSSGKLTGFAHGLEIKEKLLNLEKENNNNRKNKE